MSEVKEISMRLINLFQQVAGTVVVMDGEAGLVIIVLVMGLLEAEAALLM